jgi:N-acetylglucosaminyl-diphospho-decaprenol L-rhamnosyltransferase
MAGPPPDDARVSGIGVVTVSYGSGEVLRGFIGSVAASSTSPLSVVVVDNLPEGDAGVRRQTEAAHATYVPMPRNVGYGTAMNAGVAALPSDIDWILLSNPDVILGEGAVDRLLATARGDSSIAAAGPKILTSDGDVYPSARAVPSLRTGVGHALFVNLWVGNPWTRAYRNDTTGPVERRDAGWLSGACLLVRRSAFEQLGGFDPGYFMYFEDVDLGYRLGKSGYRNVYEPDAVVTHYGAHSTSSESGRLTSIAAHHDSARRFLNQKYAGALLWPIRVTLTIGLQLRSALLKRRAARQ